MVSTVEKRSADQNRFYWRMIGNWSSWLNVNPEDLHDFLKNKFHNYLNKADALYKSVCQLYMLLERYLAR